MKEINVAILDDEQLAIDSLVWELKRCNYKINVISTFTNPVNALQNLKNHKIDLLFLDIQMPQMTGFEFIEIYNNLNFNIVFVTAYDQYAIKAFKYSALDYLLKPIENEQLNIFFEKFSKNKKQTQLKEQLVIQQSVITNSQLQKVVFSTQESLEFVNPNEILYCEADGNYTIVVLQNRKFTLSKTLKETESMLLDFNFLRIHQSYYINPIHVERYLKSDGGNVVMKDGKVLSVSRSKKDDFFSKFIEKLKQ